MALPDAIEPKDLNTENNILRGIYAVLKAGGLSATITGGATDATLSEFEAANHTDLQALLTKLGAVVLAAGTAVVGKVDHTTTSIGHGHKESTTVGTAVALAASTAAKWVAITAYASNTNRVAIGGAGVNASGTAGTGTGVSLAAGETISFPIDNLADVYLDVVTSGEGVRFTYGS